MSGALHAIGRAGEKPVPPLNLVADFGGGGMLLAFGVVCGILESRESGQGQVVDASMTDGAALQMAMIYGLKAAGKWNNQRGTNLLDGGAHFYDTYECADRRFVAVGSIEPQFYTLLLDKMGLTDPAFRMQMDKTQWPNLKEKLAALFKTKTRDEWCELLEGTDACVAPVLDMDEAPRHVHNAARHTFVEVEGVFQPTPAPRFSRTQPTIQRPPSDNRSDEASVEWGFD